MHPVVSVAWGSVYFCSKSVFFEPQPQSVWEPPPELFFWNTHEYTSCGPFARKKRLALDQPPFHSKPIPKKAQLPTEVEGPELGYPIWVPQVTCPSSGHLSVAPPPDGGRTPATPALLTRMSLRLGGDVPEIRCRIWKRHQPSKRGPQLGRWAWTRNSSLAHNCRSASPERQDAVQVQKVQGRSCRSRSRETS